jgi:uncharacterized membrane protein YjjP (DUF1212 family)
MGRRSGKLAVYLALAFGTAGLAVMLLRGGSDLTVGMTGLAGFVVLALANAALFVYDRLFER